VILDFINILCDVDFQSAFQSYVDSNGTGNITSPVEVDSSNVSGDVQAAVLTADAVELLQQENRQSTSRFSDVGQNTAKLNLSSQLLGCSSSSHNVVSFCSL